jgi:hypothetical protein
MTQRKVLPIASIRSGGYNRPIELPHSETFPGAACYQPIELPSYKAAPLQAFGPLNPRAKSGLHATEVAITPRELPSRKAVPLPGANYLRKSASICGCSVFRVYSRSYSRPFAVKIRVPSRSLFVSIRGSSLGGVYFMLERRER